MPTNKKPQRQRPVNLTDGNLRGSGGLRLEDLLPDEASRAAALARFWRKTNRDTATEHSCWIWLAAKWWTGYGRFGVGGESVSAHRFAFLAAGGVIPPGFHVMHLCDRRVCCNPRHLRAVSASENLRDCVWKGRHRNRAALTDAQLDGIREELAGKVWPRRVGELADRHGVEVSTVARIAIRRRRERDPVFNGGAGKGGAVKEYATGSGVTK